MKLGIDIGSVSAKCAVLDEHGKLIELRYIKNRGIIDTVKELLSGLTENITSAGVTGSGKEIVFAMIGADSKVSEIIAHARSAVTFLPDVKTVVDIGGEDSKIIIIENGRVVDFQMNHECGGGTGAMIETIAARLGVNIEDVGHVATKSQNEIHLPSKCGIFCQSAVVSKKNMGVATEDILKGVCKGVVRNYVAMLGKGREIKGPVVFQGACALNSALVSSLEEEIGIPVKVFPECSMMGAIGAALSANTQKSKFKGVKKILETEFVTKIRRSNGCANNCEIVDLIESGKVIASFGNRCDRCINVSLKKD